MGLTEVVRSLVRRTRPAPLAGSTNHLPRPLPPGSPAPPVSGVRPDGSATTVDEHEGSVTLLFLTSDCRECTSAWRHAVMEPTSTVVVTPGPETESSRRVMNLILNLMQSPEGGPTAPVNVVMSSETWHRYGVTKAPWTVGIESGVIVVSDAFGR